MSSINVKYLFKRVRRNEEGVAYIEFALVMPLLMLLLGGVVDITSLVMIHSKVDKAVFTVGDLVTQVSQDAANKDPNAHCKAIKAVQDNVVTAIMRPYAANIGTYGNYDFAVTSVLRTTSNGNSGPLRNMIEWRYDRGTQMTDSKVYSGAVTGRYKQVANLPGSLGLLKPGERLIATEMKYRYKPLLPFLSGMGKDGYQIHKISYFRGRVSTANESRNSGMLSGTCN